jgi:ketosteroid isomerase-like protein
MFKYLLSCAIILLTFNSVLAQTNEVQKIEKAVEDLKNLLVNPDQKQLENLTAKELSYGHSNGKIEDQKAFIEFLLSGESQFVTIDLQDQTVEIVGNTGIVRHTLLAETNNNGTLGNIKLGVLLIWQKKGRDWKLLARQAFK